ncbi:low affinity iron permease family protein [Rhizobium sp. BE258]|uniref:low affinity iron permease family protein n=1 Tax=Rhizobium sp. BE258 TaxID=2817722 RepID=UPI002854A805|nr:low affinity iron permease family protein [Rhizobium sp. BE258]MDR7147283.1 low affinity Fe/Cu permease [Rhizobium sp. BE258]
MEGAKKLFAHFATKISELAGAPVTFVLAVISVLVWAGLGPVFDYSETWQLVINTGTTIVTFLMVFVLQNAQTRDTRAIQAKLDEIILTSHAENRFIGIENLDEDDLKHLDRLVAKAAKGRRNAQEDGGEVKLADEDRSGKGPKRQQAATVAKKASFAVKRSASAKAAGRKPMDVKSRKQKAKTAP